MSGTRHRDSPAAPRRGDEPMPAATRGRDVHAGASSARQAAAFWSDVLACGTPPRPRSLVERYGGLYSRALGIDVRHGRREDVFKWFLASLLFGARISETLAIRTWRALAAEGLTTPGAILAVGWERLVQVLDRGGYVRYDFKTADKLLAVCGTLQQDYRGDLNRLHAAARDEADLETRLHALGKGVGAVTINIFLRELRGVWEKAAPAPSERVLQAAKTLHLLPHGAASPMQALDVLHAAWLRDGGTAENFAEFEAALVRFDRLRRGRRANGVALGRSTLLAEGRRTRRRSRPAH